MAGSAARTYFESIRHGTTEPQRRAYADDAVLSVHGVFEAGTKQDVVDWFEEIYGAVPDFRFDILSLTETGDTTAVHWRVRGTFAGPGTYQGLEPNGAQLDLTGVDVVVERDGLLVRNDAYLDALTFSRQVGVLPAAGSVTEERMTRAINVRTRIGRHLRGGDPEPIADGVWRVQGGDPARCNVYLVRDGDGVLLFDAGARVMIPSVATAAARLGGLTRIVLGHGHTDHRGTAPAFDVPVLCHPDEIVDAEGAGGWRYWDADLEFLPRIHRPAHRFLHAKVWDGGPVAIAGTVADGDDVAGFEVVHLPGHAPGMIALWRASDRLALTSDAFYTIDLWGRNVAPQLPIAGYNHDTEQARASLRRLAGLAPAAAWPGHARPGTGDVAAQLLRAAG